MSHSTLKLIYAFTALQAPLAGKIKVDLLSFIKNVGEISFYLSIVKT